MSLASRLSVGCQCESELLWITSDYYIEQVVVYIELRRVTVSSYNVELLHRTTTSNYHFELHRTTHKEPRSEEPSHSDKIYIFIIPI